MNEKTFKTKRVESEEEVIQFYQEYAKTWDERFGNLPSTRYFIEKRWELFGKFLIKYNLVGKDAIELGVGTGIYIERSAKSFNKLLAIDGSKRMLTELENKINRFEIDEKVSVDCLNVLDLKNVRSESFDVLYYFGLIEHIIDIDKFLSECQRVLKKDGIMIGVTPNGKSPWYTYLRKGIRSGKHCSTDHYYSTSELKNIFKNKFRLIDYKYWGAVPAGLKSKFFFEILKVVELIFESIPFLNTFLGGLTFVAKKSN